MSFQGGKCTMEPQGWTLPTMSHLRSIPRYPVPFTNGYKISVSWYQTHGSAIPGGWPRMGQGLARWAGSLLGVVLISVTSITG